MGQGEKRPGEFELIERYFRPLAGRAGLGLRDDVALLSPDSGFELAVTVDAIVEGFDFLADDPPEAIAAKALRVNLSDLAAKGAEPFAYLLALGLPDHWTETFVARFAAGLAKDQGLYGVDLIGGDMGRSGERLTVTITAFGRVPTGTLVTRDGAEIGDTVVVTSTIGDAALGLRLRKAGATDADGEDARHLLGRLRYPRPRTELAPLLRRYATAAIDVSDGLVADLGALCDASGVSAEVDAERVPLSPAAERTLAADPALIETILTGGEDYEILFTAASGDAEAAIAEAAALGISVTAIGTVLAGEATPTFRHSSDTLRFARPGWDHFG
ncbi:MAG: thiamine-phosphate kinase [Bauldia sp.]